MSNAEQEIMIQEQGFDEEIYFLCRTELNEEQIAYSKSISLYSFSFLYDNIRPDSNEEKRIYYIYLVRKIYRKVVSGKICSIIDNIIELICVNINDMGDAIEEIDRKFFSDFLHKHIDLYQKKYNIEKKKYIENIITCEIPISKKYIHERTDEDGNKVESISIRPKLERQSRKHSPVYDIELEQKLISIKKITRELSNIIELYIKDLIFKSEVYKTSIIKLELILKGTENQINIYLTGFYIIYKIERTRYIRILKKIKLNINTLHKYRQDELEHLKYEDMCYTLYGLKRPIEPIDHTDVKGREEWIQYKQLLCYLHNRETWHWPNSLLYYM
jgi:hypothetical protein